jgi:cellulose synthase/poly-beta-1,6-N-acetylglucosamine synthase-like glycosyltransferase
MSAGLDAVRELHHPSYKIVGLLAWLTMGLSLVGAVASPRFFLMGARLFAFYLLARLTINVFFYLSGIVRCRAWQRRETSGFCAARQAGESNRVDDVHHVAIIPNYEEPLELLCRTLHALAVQEGARRSLTVVLAMEEREPGASAKARTLCARFVGCFAHLLVTFHPANLPGEIPCKGSNMAWAARQAKRELVDRLGLPLEKLTLTACDADSILHPRYFAVLTRLFADDPKRHRRFWYAPVFYHNNIGQVPAVIRLLSSINCAGRLGELANPLSWPLPFSTYTLSFALVTEVGYWDPAVIAEDWHMYLRCFFATNGRVDLKPVFLPTSADAVGGETIWQALASYYRQQVRHAWGAEDVGYILQQWHRSSGTPLYKRFFCFFWVLHHHALRSTSWFILALGSLASALSGDTLLVTLPSRSIHLGLIQAINIIGVVSAVTMWIVARAHGPPCKELSRPAALVQESAAWALLPILSFVFTALPGLHAQTKLLFGSPLVVQRTPKGLRFTQAVLKQ